MTEQQIKGIMHVTSPGTKVYWPGDIVSMSLWGTEIIVKIINNNLLSINGTYYVEVLCCSDKRDVGRKEHLRIEDERLLSNEEMAKLLYG